MSGKKRVPRLHELVIGTVARIEEHGAFVKLDEYGGLEAYVPLNEVSHSWFKSIREVLKVGQKRVFKVIRVDPRRGLVDISLKRVTDIERRQKMQEWKRFQRAMKLIELAANKLGKSLNEALEEAYKLEGMYGEIFAGLEVAVREGKEALTKAGVGEPWLSVFYDLAKSYIRIPKRRISVVFSVSCTQGDGVERLRKILTSWNEIQDRFSDVSSKFYVIGSPRYRMDVEAYDPKRAEAFISEVAKLILSRASELGCQASFERLKTE